MHPKNPPPNALIVENVLDHHYHALCAEWRLFPASRRVIAAELDRHPEWGVALQNDQLVQIEPRKALNLPKTTYDRTSNYARVTPVLKNEVATPIRSF